jgi:hypothetical protein
MAMSRPLLPSGGEKWALALAILPVAAVLGAVAAVLWARRAIRWACLGLAGALVLAAGGFSARYLPTFFGEYNRRPFIYHKYHTDLVEACGWLKPKLDQYDAVVCTTLNINQPYILLLHELEYDPARWLADRKDFDPSFMFDRYFGFGKFTFLQYGQMLDRDGSGRSRLYLDPQSQARLREVRAAGAGRKAIFLLRPGEEKFLEGVGELKVVHQITTPDGNPSLLLCEAAW